MADVEGKELDRAVEEIAEYLQTEATAADVRRVYDACAIANGPDAESNVTSDAKAMAAHDIAEEAAAVAANEAKRANTEAATASTAVNAAGSPEEAIEAHRRAATKHRRAAVAHEAAAWAHVNTK